jgi:acyl-CoA dehydrogenase
MQSVAEIEASPGVQDLRNRVSGFLNELIYPNEKILERGGDEASRTFKAIQAEAKKRGLWALGLPKEIGGGGLEFMPYVFVNEIVGRSEYAIAGLGTHSAQDATMLHLYGNPEQKKRWLAPLVNGDIYPSFSMTEPEVSGADPTGLRTRAVQDGDEWVINGHKWFTSGANVAAFSTVMCVTEPDAPAHERFSMIVVPTDTKGYQIVRIVPVMGETSGGHCEIKYTDVRVPLTNLLGPRGQAFKIAQKRLGPGRIYHCMRWLGQAQRAFELMVDRAINRQAFGGPLSDKQTIQNWIADSAAEIQAARLLTLNAAAKIDAGDEAGRDITDQILRREGAARRYRSRDPGAWRDGGVGGHAAGPDVPSCTLRSNLRWARRSASDGGIATNRERVQKGPQVGLRPRHLEQGQKKLTETS